MLAQIVIAGTVAAFSRSELYCVHHFQCAHNFSGGVGRDDESAVAEFFDPIADAD